MLQPQNSLSIMCRPASGSTRAGLRQEDEVNHGRAPRSNEILIKDFKISRFFTTLLTEGSLSGLVWNSRAWDGPSEA